MYFDIDMQHSFENNEKMQTKKEHLWYKNGLTIDDLI